MKKYIFLNKRNENRCGNSYGRYGIGYGCSSKCRDDSTEFCGGPWHNNIYEILKSNSHKRVFKILNNINYFKKIFS